MGNPITNNAIASLDAARIKVIHGANDGVFGLAGAKVATIRFSLVDAFNIPDDALAFVNGEQVDYDFRLQGGATLEFVRQDGEKRAFRYPGGKNFLKGKIIAAINEHLHEDMQYREPFFGGGSVGLQLLRQKQVSSIWINDRHPGVAAYWTSVIRYPDRLIEEVLHYTPRRDEYDTLRQEMKTVTTVPDKVCELVSLAVKKLVIQRVSFNGRGEKAGAMGESEFLSRWKPAKRVQEIMQDHQLFSDVKVQDNRCACIDYSTMLIGDRCLPYLDPPYWTQGNSLYRFGFNADDHKLLASRLQQRHGPWILSYDDCREIRQLYAWATIDVIDEDELLIRPRI